MKLQEMEQSYVHGREAFFCAILAERIHEEVCLGCRRCKDLCREGAVSINVVVP